MICIDFPCHLNFITSHLSLVYPFHFPSFNSKFDRISFFYGPCQCDARTVSEHQSFIYGKVFFFFFFFFSSIFLLFPPIIYAKVHVNCPLLIFFTKVLSYKVNNTKDLFKQNKSFCKIPPDYLCQNFSHDLLFFNFYDLLTFFEWSMRNYWCVEK